MNIRTVLGASFAALLAAPGLGLADENTDDVALPVWHAETRFAFVLGFADGGDDIATAVFSDDSTEKIKAGAGVHYAAGIWQEITPQIIVQATYGYFVDEVSATNSNMRFSRYPLDLLVYYRPKDFHFGAGVTKHMNPKFDGDGFLGNIEFDDAQGTVFEIGYRWFAFRHTKIKYDTPGLAGELDGNSFEILLTAAFR